MTNVEDMVERIAYRWLGLEPKEALPHEKEKALKEVRWFLRAIVEELGITWESVDRSASQVCSDPLCLDCGGAMELTDALTALLDCAEVEP